ncbi:MAG: hypothetical protein ACJ749_17850, partial [Flavisolibacter sp.]
LYATLLMPFWDKNPGVQVMINQMLASNDKRLKYNTAMLLLRNKKHVPDTLLNYFAKLDDYRYTLYSDLKEYKLLNLFPVAYHNQADLAKSKILGMSSSYDKPDSMVFIDKLPVQYKERSGYVYFFKYKKKKDDSDWNLASVGIVSADPKEFEFPKKQNYFEELQYGFTHLAAGKIEEDEPMMDQLKKALKKMQYSKRNSASEFYNDEDRGRMDLFQSINFRD